jgi:predicted PurR-regulated permease PerM
MTSNRGIEQFVGAGVLLLLVVGCFVVLRPFISALLWAIVLAFATRPLYARLEGLLAGRRSLAAAVMTGAIAVILVVPVLIIGWSLADDVAYLGAAVQAWVSQPPPPPEWLSKIPLIGRDLYSEWSALVSDSERRAAELAAYLASARHWIVGIGVALSSAAIELLMSLLIAYFLFRDGSVLAERLTVAVHRLAGPQASRLITVAGSTIKGVVYALAGANLIQAVLGALGFWLAGIPGPFFLGLLIFFLTLVPMGPTIVWVPAVLWLFYSDATGSAIFLAIWCIIVFPVLENVLRLFFMTRGGDSPVIILLLGMLGGLAAFGFLGIFLGPTLLAVGYTVITEWISPSPSPPSGLDETVMRQAGTSPIKEPETA